MEKLNMCFINCMILVLSPSVSNLDFNYHQFQLWTGLEIVKGGYTRYLVLDGLERYLGICVLPP